MKVFIGPYPEWIGPFQIAKYLMFWKNKEHDSVHKFGEWLAENKDGTDSKLYKFCNWFHEKFNKRTVKIKIHNYDIWSLDSTMNLILLPMFKRLREDKHGSGFIDDEDVPVHLWSNVEPPKDPDIDNLDGKFHERYQWVLDEIIWTLEQEVNDNWEEQYWNKKPELDLDEYPEDKGKTFIPVRWKVEGAFDIDGYEKHANRIRNGFRLMGKYWQTFWT